MFKHPSGRDLTYREMWENCREVWVTLKEVYPPRRLMIVTGFALFTFILISLLARS